MKNIHVFCNLRLKLLALGLAGRLTEIDVYVVGKSSDSLTAEVRRTSQGMPSENRSDILATVDFKAGQVPTVERFMPIDVSKFGIQVSPGDVLAIVLSTPGDITWYGHTLDPYGGGRWWLSGASGCADYWCGDPDVDLGFQTFVATSQK